MLKRFFVMLAILGLFDAGYFDIPVWLDVFQALVSAYYLLSPSSTRRILLMLGSQISVAVFSMPAISNHLIFQTIVNLYLVCELGWEWKRKKQLPKLDDSEFEQRICGNLRGFLASLYFFFTLHKLNRDFFDPDVSCAGVTLKMLASRLFLQIGAFRNFWITEFLIWAAILSEGLGPVLLFTRRFKKLGFFLLANLHILLMLFAIDINWLMLAYLILFIPEGITNRVLNPFLNRLRTYPRPLRLAGSALFFLLCLNAKMYFHFGAQYRPATLVLYDLLAASLVAAFLPVAIAFLREKAPLESRPHFPAFNLSAPFLLAWIFIGFGPYLGFRNVSSANMYSNLRTEGWSNHFLIPKGFLQLSGEIDRLVEFPEEAFNSLHYQRVKTGFSPHGGRKLLIPEFELGRIAALSDKFSSNPAAEPARERFLSSSWPKKKLFWFRAISNGETVQCTW